MKTKKEIQSELTRNRTYFDLAMYHSHWIDSLEWALGKGERAIN